MTPKFGPLPPRIPAAVLALGLLAPIAIAPARAQDDALPKAEEVLAQYIEVTGGAAAYEALSSRKVTGSIEFVGAGLKGTLLLQQQAPARMKTTLELENVGTFVQGTDGTVAFALTDRANQVQVRYRGLLPDLFREGQGIVAQGRLGGDGVFDASEVLAKHDENYMPKEVADALKAAGVWQEGQHGGGAKP